MWSWETLNVNPMFLEHGPNVNQTKCKGKYPRKFACNHIIDFPP